MRVINLPRVKGRSGVLHQFQMLVEGNVKWCTLDFYAKVQEDEILRTFFKKFDTGKPSYAVSLGSVSEAALDLAKNYEIEVFRSEDFPKIAEYLKNMLS